MTTASSDPQHPSPPGGIDALLPQILDLLVDAVCVVDTREHFVFVSAACEHIFGYRPEEMIGRPMIDFVYPADRQRTLQAIDEILGGQPKPHFENRYTRKDGRVVHVMWSARWSESHQVRVAVARDVTGRKRAEALQAALYSISEAAHACEDLPALLQHVHHVIGELLPAENFGVALYDARSDSLSFPYAADSRAQTPAVDALYTRVLRSGAALLLTPGVDAGGAEPDWLGVPLRSEQDIIGVLAVYAHSGAVRYTEQDRDLLQFVSTQVAAAIARKQMETRLRHVAQHDHLTDLPNRELFHERLQAAIDAARRDGGHLSLLYIDLDLFKQVNDTFGHATGDQLLQAIAQRLRHCVRESDTVGRIGGDEFLVLLNHLYRADHAAAVAEKIRTMLSQPFDLAGVCVTISPSIGIALYPEHGEDHEQLIRHADAAMYGAKRDGGNRLRMTSPEHTPPD